MKYEKPETPELTDESVKKHTGKSWKQWFDILDKFDGLEKGRRECTSHLYDVHGVKDNWWIITIAVEYEIARGEKCKDGRPQGYGICATKSINAEPAKVFAVWADPKTWPKWFGKSAKVDFRVGGKFSSADGDGGEFTKVRDNKDLKFTWHCPRHTEGSVAEVQFQVKAGGKCIVMVNHNRIQKRHEADELREAWLGALDVVKKMAEEGK